MVGKMVDPGLKVGLLVLFSAFRFVQGGGLGELSELYAFCEIS